MTNRDLITILTLLDAAAAAGVGSDHYPDLRDLRETMNEEARKVGLRAYWKAPRDNTAEMLGAAYALTDAEGIV